MLANNYHFVEHWDIPDATPDEVYAVISDAKLLPRWWQGVYLSAEALDPGGEPRVGDKARVTARGFLPYRLNFMLEATVLEPGRLVETRAVGDFIGVWRALLSPNGAGTRVDIDWTVTVEKPLVRRLSPLLKPLFVRNHNWTTPRGEAGLRAYLARQRQARLTTPAATALPRERDTFSSGAPAGRSAAHSTLEPRVALRVGGVGLALGGAGLLAASLSYPLPRGGGSYHDLTARVIVATRTHVANWLFLGSMLALAIGLWCLLDSGLFSDARARVAARIALVAALFLSVDMAVFVAAWSERAAYVARLPTPLFTLGETMDTLGWPVFGLATVGLALWGARSARLTPGWAGLLGAFGGVSTGVAAVLSAGLHVKEGVYFFIPALLLWIWLLWAGLSIVRATLPARVAASEPLAVPFDSVSAPGA